MLESFTSSSVWPVTSLKTTSHQLWEEMIQSFKKIKVCFCFTVVFFNWSHDPSELSTDLFNGPWPPYWELIKYNTELIWIIRVWSGGGGSLNPRSLPDVTLGGSWWTRLRSWTSSSSPPPFPLLLLTYSYHTLMTTIKTYALCHFIRYTYTIQCKQLCLIFSFIRL